MRIIGDDLQVIGQGNPAMAGLANMIRSQQAAGNMPRVAAAVPNPGWMRGQEGVERGISIPEEEMDMLPFDEVLNSATFDATHSLLNFVAQPQRPFRGERVIMTAVASIGGVISDGLDRVKIDPAIYVGATQVGATQGGFPASAFRPGAFGVRLSFPRAGQGTRIFVPLTVVGAIAVGDSIVVTMGVIGAAVR